MPQSDFIYVNGLTKLIQKIKVTGLPQGVKLRIGRTELWTHEIASGGSKSSLNIASYSANFTKMAFKNLAIYDGKNLSKDDCIKAYNYLQTLKAK